MQSYSSSNHCGRFFQYTSHYVHYWWRRTGRSRPCRLEAPLNTWMSSKFELVFFIIMTFLSAASEHICIQLLFLLIINCLQELRGREKRAEEVHEELLVLNLQFLLSCYQDSLQRRDTENFESITDNTIDHFKMNKSTKNKIKCCCLQFVRLTVVWYLVSFYTRRPSWRGPTWDFQDQMEPKQKSSGGSRKINSQPHSLSVFVPLSITIWALNVKKIIKKRMTNVSKDKNSVGTKWLKQYNDFF